ncbi:MOSC domain-containing protein [Polyangium aurulentum]|uniref:MOSC domain-containing protein n=1 Tax=Polyangium aurulentum TaxID=2567896 RepID=UPI00146D7474|nr:MOSC N-terminal beta barrel domain-containing protein [Polyangium aurulentum]UQA58015.1 MOSC domain-containing protein [Polyangium aurulentum]
MSDITVSGIFVYPVKGARGIALDRASVGDRGITHDRRFMITTPEGRFLTQREYPQLALLETSIEPDALVLRAPRQEPLRVPLRPEGRADKPVRVWDDRCNAVAAGGDAAAYLSAFLGTNVELVYMPDEVERLVDPGYAHRKEKVGFADAFPFLLASEGSLADLNARLEKPLPMNRFRPNFVVRGASAWAEDEWSTLSIGAMTFHVRKGCDRCAVTTVDQATGDKGKEPLATLAQFRSWDSKVWFAVNLVAEGEGEVRVGDALTLRQPSYSRAG